MLRVQRKVGITSASQPAGAIPEDQQVIVSTNRGEPLVLRKKLTLSGLVRDACQAQLDFLLCLTTCRLPYCT